MPKVVSNSSPLIHLAKIKKIDLLKELFGRVIVPQAVYNECTIESFKETKQIKDKEWITIKKVKNENMKRALLMYLDDGEAEAITLAAGENADLLLLDDYDAREFARKYGIPITGIIGILLKAKYVGEIKKIKPHVDKLRETGFWINDELYMEILKEAKE